MYVHILWEEIQKINKAKIKNDNKRKVNKKKWHVYHDLHLCQWNLREVVELKSQKLCELYVTSKQKDGGEGAVSRLRWREIKKQKKQDGWQKLTQRIKWKLSGLPSSVIEW